MVEQSRQQTHRHDGNNKPGQDKEQGEVKIKFTDASKASTHDTPVPFIDPGRKVEKRADTGKKSDDGQEFFVGFSMTYGDT